jgi:hypothetical protein
VVSESVDGRTVLLGEAKWMQRPPSAAALAKVAHGIASKPPPDLGERWRGRVPIRAVFVPEAPRAGRAPGDVLIVTGRDLGLR